MESQRSSRRMPVGLVGLVVLTCVLVSHGVPAWAGVTYEVSRVTFFSGSYSAHYPSINNSGEIVWVQLAGGASTDPDLLVSSLRGTIASGYGGLTWPCINDSGEVVWHGVQNHVHQIMSSVRGQVTFGDDSGYGHSVPGINNLGEIVWREYVDANFQIVSNVRGQITYEPKAHDMPDINDSGEVIWTETIAGVGQVVSSTRGQITFGSTSAMDPAFNDEGEVVWAGYGTHSYTDIFSSINGQITDGFYYCEEPDINDAGVVVFSENGNIYMAVPTPEPATLSLLALGGLALLRHRRAW